METAINTDMTGYLLATVLQCGVFANMEAHGISSVGEKYVLIAGLGSAYDSWVAWAGEIVKFIHCVY